MAVSNGVSAFSSGMRRDEQERKALVIDCEAVLERLGISDFSIDWGSRTVRLVNRGDLRKLADYFAFKLHSGAEGFEKYGWQWLLHDQNKEGVLH